VTIPGEIRAALGLLPHTQVEFELRGGEAVIRKAGMGGVGMPERPRGRAIVEHLIREGRPRWRSELSTDEILRMVRGEPPEV
jgi:bifunctional DNA-binding transcriptional regulator/antitoxin component of YhaV-PrlF toxin-antitoxin module